MVDVKRWLSYKGTCHVILLAKLHDMYLYKTDNFFHINHYSKSVSKVALLHRFYCTGKTKIFQNSICYFYSACKSISGKHVTAALNMFVCVEVLRPSQPNGVMSSAVSLPNHTFTGQA